ncbi:MAG TPA: D-alanyl-D-alanine carboxypeptidase family protein [Steroidobacteraceae bacterium]|nr:D-alanyl-D-alanine carboxypeptidase family protein [Steroidobacteraceae bacterium]
MNKVLYYAMPFALGVALTLSACGSKTDTTAAVDAAPVQPAQVAQQAGMTSPSAASALPAPPTVPVPPPPAVPGRGYLLLDFASGQTLAAKNENERLEPASLTKIMTAYAVFDALRSGSLKLTDTATISEHAWRSGGAVTEGSTSFLPINSMVPIEVLLRGMIVQSGNDASIALAERVAGSENAFAQLLNSYAQRLGLAGSHFENATGLPGPNHYTTARDMALLSIAIVRDFPQYYHYFAEKEYTYNGITQHNRNGLLLRDSSVDGLKTGHTEKAGYCLVTSAKRDSMRLVTVVMGTASIKQREDATSALLNYGFNFYESHKVLSQGQVLGSVRVWKGAANEVSLTVTRDVLVTLPRGRASQLKNELRIPASIIAPVVTNGSVGSVQITLEGKTLIAEPLHPTENIEGAGFFGRMVDSLRMTFE